MGDLLLERILILVVRARCGSVVAGLGDGIGKRTAVLDGLEGAHRNLVHLVLVIVGAVECDDEVFGDVVHPLVLVFFVVAGVLYGADGVLPLVCSLGELLGEFSDGGLGFLGNADAVHVVVELDILDRAVDVLVDVVVQQVLVEAEHEDEFAHRGDEARVALEYQRAVGSAKFLEVANLSKGIEDTGDTYQSADEVSEGGLGDDVDTGFCKRLAVVRYAVFLIPGVVAPDGILGRCGDSDFGEGLVVSKRVSGLVAAGHLADVALAVCENHVEQTADGDFPCLGGSVLGSVDHKRPGSVLVVMLVAGVVVIITAGLADRDEVDVLPCGTLLDQVLAFGLHGTDGSLPNIETLYEFLSEFLEGG